MAGAAAVARMTANTEKPRFSTAALLKVIVDIDFGEEEVLQMPATWAATVSRGDAILA
jgi:hypothetical protein